MKGFRIIHRDAVILIRLGPREVAVPLHPETAIQEQYIAEAKRCLLGEGMGEPPTQPYPIALGR